jgi:hypothetical protein
MNEEVTELGFPVDVERRLVKLRSLYNGSQLPTEAKLAITAMLSLPGVKIDVIAKELGTSWRTVQAIREDCRNSLSEFREGISKALMSAVELVMPIVQEKARTGELTVFDVALLIDKILLLKGEATSITEVRHDSPLMQAYDQLRTAAGIGLEAGKIPPIASMPDRQPAIEAEFEIIAGGGNAPVKELQVIDSQTKVNSFAEVSATAGEQRQFEPVASDHPGGGGGATSQQIV